MLPQINVHNFSLEGPTIFFPAPFSYNYPSHSFLCMSNFNDIKLYTILHIKSSYHNFEDIMNVNGV